MTTPEARYARLRTTAVSVWAAIGVLILLAVGVLGSRPNLDGARSRS